MIRLALLVIVLLGIAGADTVRAAERPLPAFPSTRDVVMVGLQLGFAPQKDAALQAVYADKARLSFELSGHWLWQGRVGVGGGIGYWQRKGAGVSAAGDPPTARLYQVPVFVEGLLRLQVVERQVVMPYARFGYDLVFWSETFRSSVVRGLKNGVHLGGGVQFHVPFPELDFEGRAAGPPFVRGVLFHVEGWGRAANNFGGPGLDLSAGGLGFGARFLF